MKEPTRAITLRGLRIVWRVLLFAVILYVWIAEKDHPKDRQMSQGFYISICAVSAWLIGGMFFVKKRSAEQLGKSSGASDPKNIRRAYAIQLLLMGGSLAVVLYGLVVRFRGATFAQALPFYVVGSSLLLYFKPKDIGSGSKLTAEASSTTTSGPD